MPELSLPLRFESPLHHPTLADIFNASNDVVADEVSKRYAEYIVAAVNACAAAGLTVEDLARGVVAKPVETPPFAVGDRVQFDGNVYESQVYPYRHYTDSFYPAIWDGTNATVEAVDVDLRAELVGDPDCIDALIEAGLTMAVIQEHTGRRWYIHPDWVRKV